MSTSSSPIFVQHLFAPLHDRLLELLRDLLPADWHRPTVCTGWDVKDIAAHLLDGMLRRLAFARDGYSSPVNPPTIASYADLVTYLNQLNHDWVRAMRRLSPRQLIELLAEAGPHVHAWYAQLPPFEPAPFPVAWAGETTSANWFDVARDYTEHFHHQQQIRLAVDRPGILTAVLYGPFLEIFMRGLPHAYRAVAAPSGAAVQVRVMGEGGGTWFVQRQANESWTLVRTLPTNVLTAAVTIPGELAWRLFSKGISPEVIRPQVELAGDIRLAETALRMVAVMA